MTVSRTPDSVRTSVVVPCYNDGATLRETVASVLREEPTELVVVDDGSSDADTLAVVEELERDGVRVLRQENGGVSRARMAGVRVTSAPYVFPLDADDVLLPGALAALGDALDSQPDAVAAWGDTRFFGDVNVRVRATRRIDPWRLTFVNELPSAGLFRRDRLVEAGGWTLRDGYEDWDLWMALAERGWGGVYVGRAITGYRVHGLRMWRESATRHAEIVAELRRRHPDLFARRQENKRHSDSGPLVRLVLPTIEQLPLPDRARLALANALTRPGPILRLVTGRRLEQAQRRLPGPRAETPGPPLAPGATGRSDGIVVIGAGPYGLSVAAHLRRAGVPVRVFGRPFESWEQHMPAGMLLRSHWRASYIADPERELGLDRFHESNGLDRTDPLSLERFVEYGRWFQREAVPDLDHRSVDRLSTNGRGFELELGDGELVRANRVVVAAGIVPFATRPPGFDNLPGSLVSHSVDHSDLAIFAGRRVAVVGAGQSALEYAALLAEHDAQVELLVRAAEVRWLAHEGVSEDRRLRLYAYRRIGIGGPQSSWVVAMPSLFRRLPRDWREPLAYRCIRPAGAGWLRPRLERVSISLAHSLRSATARGDELELELDDRSRRVVDHLLLATGFRIDISRYAFLDDGLVAKVVTRAGYPVLDGGLESSVPGLHFVGAAGAESFGPVMRFVCGTWVAARAVTRRVAGRTAPRGGFSW